MIRLEELAAEVTGKEEAVPCQAARLGNQIALAAHCSPGDAIIEEEAPVAYEVGAPALIARGRYLDLAVQAGSHGTRGAARAGPDEELAHPNGLITP